MPLSRLTVTSPYLELDPLFYSLHDPIPLASARMISFNHDAAALLGLQADERSPRLWREILNGTVRLPGSTPYAMCYAGHQFGYYVPRLGDGRAINLGGINGWHVQLKGAGQTLYSRQGDGRAVLRSSIREYLCAEAMAGLGIPTTRSLAIIGSDTKVMREWEAEEGAIVARLSLSWVRFGTFEYFAADRRKLAALADHVIRESYPEFIGVDDRYALMFEEAVARTARLMAQWMAVGFCHGVMNTDNMSIAGLTIDYGPFAFMDRYDAGYICNHTDREGRYSYGNQPRIGRWNLARLGRVLEMLIPKEKIDAIMEAYAPLYSRTYIALMAAKLGIEEPSEEDMPLIGALFGMMQRNAVDYTVFFHRLSRYRRGDREGELMLLADDRDDLAAWLDRYDARMAVPGETDEERCRRMTRVNPKYVLKNYMLQDAIDAAAKGDNTLVEGLLDLARDPYAAHPQWERYALPSPPHAANGRLSCSS